MNEKKALVFLATGFEEIEAAAIIDVLRRGNVETLTVSVTGDKTVVGVHNLPFVADELFENVDCNAYDAIVLPGGGPGSEMLNRHKGVRKTLVDFHKANKYLAAICAAPRVLGNLGLIDGKVVTCYPGIEPEMGKSTLSNLEVATDITDEHVVTTGIGPGVAIDFALNVLNILKGRDEDADAEVKAIRRAMFPKV